jgi:hypothetical protein
MVDPDGDISIDFTLEPDKRNIRMPGECTNRKSIGHAIEGNVRSFDTAFTKVSTHAVRIPYDLLFHADMEQEIIDRKRMDGIEKMLKTD